MLLHFSMFFASGSVSFTGWDQAEVNRLEQKTFELDDEIVISESEVDAEWADEIQNQLYDTIDHQLIGITIADYN